ncbi:hypothetical protein CVT25_000493 [Psilocybe cyanescens]|uniref:Uncharacterized protein n=1 Tax=Psilocybe cyanescens TaxID=93625 RepID=A0A409XWA3_PSICY|nr:hypothetical protein CVT25_000493 [Psilocybe cyanescens]
MGLRQCRQGHDGHHRRPPPLHRCQELRASQAGGAVQGEKSKVAEKCKDEVELVSNAMKKIEEVNTLHDKVAKRRTTPDQRVVGFTISPRSPPLATPSIKRAAGTPKMVSSWLMASCRTPRSATPSTGTTIGGCTNGVEMSTHIYDCREDYGDIAHHTVSSI